MSRVPSNDVVPLDRTDSGRAGEVMGRAFHDSDQWASLLPDPNVRQTKLEQMFAGTVKLTYAAGGLVETTPGLEAVAMWLPPGKSIGLWPVVKSGFASVRFVVTPPFPNLRRLTATMRQFDEIHRHQMPSPHWYLMALGVDPESQGCGYGTALVLKGIERANSDNRPIYLETETDANASFYQRLGFETLDEITIDAIGMPFSLMIRRPGPAAV
jgi:GNAT superfamily N-acetyltransferase